MCGLSHHQTSLCRSRSRRAYRRPPWNPSCGCWRQSLGTTTTPACYPHIQGVLEHVYNRGWQPSKPSCALVPPSRLPSHWPQCRAVHRTSPSLFLHHPTPNELQYSSPSCDLGTPLPNGLSSCSAWMHWDQPSFFFSEEALPQHLPSPSQLEEASLDFFSFIRATHSSSISSSVDDR